MNKKEERRNNILLGAFKLFMSKEYANVTTSDLEEVTGVSRGAIYYKGSVLKPSCKPILLSTQFHKPI